MLELSPDYMKPIFARGKKMVTKEVIKMNENEASYTYTFVCYKLFAFTAVLYCFVVQL